MNCKVTVLLSTALQLVQLPELLKKGCFLGFFRLALHLLHTIPLLLPPSFE